MLKIEQMAEGRGTDSSGFLRSEDCYHVVSLSGGKDSTAMLILMVEREYPIDLVLFADTGMEFPEMYDHLAKVDDFLYQERGLHITTLRHPQGFDWLMFEEPKKKQEVIEKRLRLGMPIKGNGWPGIKVRWCTGQLKIDLVEKEIRRLKANNKVIEYVGIAADEVKRCKGKNYPLVEWEITESEALKICYEHGFDFGGLYDIYRRASCWCCPFQRIDELRKLRLYHPQQWEKLREMDIRAREMFGVGPKGQFKQRWSVEMLERRFAAESENEVCGGGLSQHGGETNSEKVTSNGEGGVNYAG